MEKKISKKDKKFMRDFISFYFEKRELESSLLEDKEDFISKRKLEKVDAKFNKLLLRYPILFDSDLEILYGVFNEVIKEKNVAFFNKDFKLFLKGVFEELYAQKIIDKKTFDELNKFLTTFNLEVRGNFTGISGYA
ncbi:hypothetical protein KAJ87_01865 [Candidatus Pacearchaeota archaeon]|nr:hypothetical protein [Candidatus Pacearchaeota archaeon]